MNVFMSIKTAAIAAVMSVSVAGVAAAVPISGTLQIGTGPISVDLDAPDGVANIDFDQGVANDYRVGFGATGDFAGLVGMTVSMFDIDLDALAGDVWSVGGFSLALTSVVSSVLSDGGETYKLIANGTLSSTDPMLDDTLGTFQLTANGLGVTSGSFSATTVVPLPASVLLLGSGMVGLGAVARRRKKQAQAA